MSKTKEFCILTNSGYFMDVVRVFEDPKEPGRFAGPENSYDIPYPNIDYVQEGMLAKWDFINKKWVYEDRDYGVEEHLPDPLDILKVSRDLRLRQSDTLILDAIASGNTIIIEEIKEYRKQLREIVDNIQNGSFSTPVLKPNPNPFLAQKDPSELIIFNDWPTYNS